MSIFTHLKPTRIYGLWPLFLAFVLIMPRGFCLDPKPVSAICINADTGQVLYEDNADICRPPASMLKLSMMLMVVEGLEARKWDLNTPVKVSPHAQYMGGTQVYLEAGEEWPLGKLMQAVAIASANDAAMAVAEGLWGSEEVYLEAVNQRMRLLDMDQTRFHSVHGLPPDRGEQFDQTTARDMARLASACTGHPIILEWVGQKKFQFKPEQAVRYNTNKLLWRMADCDGMKTGYIRAAGFCITATAQRHGVRLISIVMGHPNKHGRFRLAQELLETAFRQYPVQMSAAPDAESKAAESVMAAPRVPTSP